jgi:NAD(P)-dependent dehydrogenase (short-subunit alcohol dehydrogenase family)
LAREVSVTTSETLQPLQIQGASVFVTGAGRGLGRALVAAFLGRGAGRVFATFRNAPSAEASGLLEDKRVEAVLIDLTSDESVLAAAAGRPRVDILVNNAAFIANAPALDAADLKAARLEMETNYWGVLRMCRAFAPQLSSSAAGAVVNILSVGALASLPFCGSYCASKAAAWSLTQSLSAEFGRRGVRVAAVFAGAIATDMARPEEMEGRCPPDVMAAEIVQALGRGELRIFPDALSRGVGETYAKSPWELIERFSRLLD